MHRIISSIHFTACVFNNRCVSSVLFQLFFFTSLMKESMITVRLQYYINSACALFLAAEVTRVFFFFHLISRSHFSHPNFTNCKLHTRMLTDTDHSRVRCSPIDSGMLKRPGTRSNRLGPDPDPADLLKYRPEPVRVPGRVPGPRVSGPP